MLRPVIQGCDAKVYEGLDRSVNTHIKKLRASLGKYGYHVETVIKAGYRWKRN